MRDMPDVLEMDSEHGTKLAVLAANAPQARNLIAHASGRQASRVLVRPVWLKRCNCDPCTIGPGPLAAHDHDETFVDCARDDPGATRYWAEV